VPSTKYVIDASMDAGDGMFCFCPIEGDIGGDYSIVTGMNILSGPTKPPGDVVAIVHDNGQSAVEEFCSRRMIDLEVLRKALENKRA